MTEPSLARFDDRRRSTQIRDHALQWILPIALTLLILSFALIDSRVVSPLNILNILQQASYLAIFAMAQTVVLVTRGFDLSLGPTVSMVSVAIALTMAVAIDGSSNVGYAFIIGVLIGTAVGCLVGLFNGFTIAYLGISPFVATLGSYNVALGISATLSGGRPVQNVPEMFSIVFYSGSIFGVPAALLISVAIGIVLHFVLSRTTFGRSLYLIGSNARAASVAGIPTRRMLTYAYLLSSGLAALGAMMLTARTGSGEPNLGGALSLQAIAAAVIGGTSLSGGSGGVATAVLGALFITVLSNGMNLTGIDGYLQMVVLGLIVIVGVMVDQWRIART